MTLQPTGPYINVAAIVCFAAEDLVRLACGVQVLVVVVPFRKRDEPARPKSHIEVVVGVEWTFYDLPSLHSARRHFEKNDSFKKSTSFNE